MVIDKYEFVSCETMLWICENCPIAANTIVRADDFEVLPVFQKVERYRVKFKDKEEFLWFSLRWA